MKCLIYFCTNTNILRFRGQIFSFMSDPTFIFSAIFIHLNIIGGHQELLVPAEAEDETEFAEDGGVRREAMGPAEAARRVPALALVGGHVGLAWSISIWSLLE